jgi:hypothetical protein
MGFDQHDNPLNYRVSASGVALKPGNVSWDASLFGEIMVLSLCRTWVPSSLIASLGPSPGYRRSEQVRILWVRDLSTLFVDASVCK